MAVSVAIFIFGIPAAIQQIGTAGGLLYKGSGNSSVVVRGTLVEVLTPDSLRGRVSAVNSIFIGLSNELGGFESGLAARLFGAVTAVVAGGIGTIVVVAGVIARWPSVAKLGSLDQQKPIGAPSLQETSN